MNPVPPLLALRAFVHVAQGGSVKQAARSLHVTPGAVSQQLRLLEERCGQPLFLREPQGLRLTPAGAQAYPPLRQAFDLIDDTLQRLCVGNAMPTLTVSVEASFAAAWLVPRLRDFTSRHPGVDVRIDATPALADLRHDGVDIALRHGLGDYAGLHSTLLMTPVLVPVASPALFALAPRPQTPADCLAFALLQDGARADWALWLRAHGVADDARARQGPSLSDDVLLLRAAQAGQGIALVPQAHARDELARGTLVQVLDTPWPARFAYYAVVRPEAVKQPAVAAFLAWVQTQAQAGTRPDEADAGPAIPC